MDRNVYAAIAMALCEYRGSNVYDIESGKITIKPKQGMWDVKLVSFTEKPRQCGAK